MSVLIRTSIFLLLFGVAINRVSAGVVIAAPDVVVESIDRNYLLSVFSMRVTRWQNGDPITVYVLSDRDPLHHAFVKKHLKVFPYQLRNIWDRAVYTGTGQSPRVVDSVMDMLDKVAQTRGAIGYVDTMEDTVDGVRVIDEY